MNIYCGGRAENIDEKYAKIARFYFCKREEEIEQSGTIRGYIFRFVSEYIFRKVAATSLLQF